MQQELGVPVRIGDVLAAKYRIDRVLGAGGMGIVVAATHLQLDQVLALKFIRTEALSNPEIINRFEREARVAVRLKSQHAARIIDVGRLDTGSPYIVMEYLDGEDLAQVLEQRGPLATAVACDYIIQACEAVAEAHGLGIVHRDLKPGNLFLARIAHGQQIIKVLDFGISKQQGPASDPSMTRTQAVMGSPGYMSPEQMRSTKNVDGRTDIWSLGVILYELVTGKVPFQADTFSALCVKIAMDPHPPMPALPAALPRGFEAVVGRALEKDPALRYQSVGELVQALIPYAAGNAAPRWGRRAPAALPIAAHPVMLTPTANTLDAATGQAGGGPLPGAGRSRRFALAGVGVAVTAALGILVVIPSRHRTMDPDDRPRATAPGAATVLRPPAPPDAGLVASPAMVTPDAGGPAPAPLADAGPSPVLGGGVPPAPLTPGTPGRSRARPSIPTVDPYSSPD